MTSTYVVTYDAVHPATPQHGAEIHVLRLTVPLAELTEEWDQAVLQDLGPTVGAWGPPRRVDDGEPWAWEPAHDLCSEAWRLHLSGEADGIEKALAKAAARATAKAHELLERLRAEEAQDAREAREDARWEP